MNDKIVNLNKVRKQRARTAARRQADDNAIKYGRSKAGKDLDKARKAQEDSRLDNHRLDKDAPGE